MKQLYIEDCLLTLKRDIEYDYVITSPPDYDELNKDITKYNLRILYSLKS